MILTLEEAGLDAGIADGAQQQRLLRGHLLEGLGGHVDAVSR